MIDKKQFTGKLNVDTSLSAMPKEDFLNAHNVRIMSPRLGGMTSVQPVEGTTSVPYPGNEDVKGEVVGACEDRHENRVFYFLFNNFGNHSIFVYDIDTNSITSLVRNDDIEGDLNFQRYNYISSQMAGGNLFFTDGVNEPRKIPVDDILSGDFQVSSVDDLTLFARPGTLPLLVEKFDSVTSGLRGKGSSNNMVDIAFQFAYRFMYLDGTYSVLSPFSKLVNYEDEDDIKYDAARLTLPLDQKIPSRTKRVQFLYREGNTGSWFIFEQVDSQDRISGHNDGTLISVPFYNDKTGIALSDEFTSKPFDMIPQTAKTLDIAKDRLFLANIKDGYDKYYIPTLKITEYRVEPEGGVSEVIGRYGGVSWTRTDLEDLRENYFFVRIYEGESYDGFYMVYVGSGAVASEDEMFSFPDVVTINEDALIITEEAYQNLVDEMGSTDAAIIRAVEEYVGIYNESHPPSTPTKEEVVYSDAFTATILGLTPPLSIEGQHFKCNGRYKIGIVFYDNYGRNAGVYTNEELTIEMAPRTYQQYYFSKGINWLLENSKGIPLWAKTYSIVRTKNLNSNFFIQSIAGLITYAAKQDDGTYTFTDTFDVETVTNIAVSIQSLIKNGLGYTYEEGDNVRILTADGQVDIVLKIEAQYGKYIIVESRDIGLLNANSGRQIGIFEIFSTTGFGETFYEVGEHYVINNPGTSQRSYSVTSGTLDGDSYVKDRVIGSNIDQQVTVETMSVNDRKWGTWIQDTGRTNLVLNDAKEELLPNTIRYSNTYVQGTDTNGLSSFDLLDKADIDEKCGPINRLLYTSSTNDSSNVLLAICLSNTASVYIGQTQVIDDSGQSILATSGNVIGTVNILKGDYGTSAPESAILADSYVYWYDNNLRKIIRYSSNGLVAISDNGVDSLMGRLGKSLWYPGGYDQNNREYLIAINTDSGQSLTALYDFYERSIGGVMVNFTGRVEDNVYLRNKTQAGVYDLATLGTGLNYEVKVAGDNIPIIINNVTVALLSSGESYIINSDRSQIVSANLNSGQAAYVMELKRSWYDVDDHENKVLVFSEVTNSFVGTRSFYPDFMLSVNDLFISFKNGDLYRHDSDEYCFFYTEASEPYLSFVFNRGQFSPQIPRGIQVESDVAPYVHVGTELPYVQSTDITSSEMRRFDDIWYGEVKRDRLTPGMKPIQGLIDGDVVRGQFVLCYVRFPALQYFSLRFVNLDFQVDRGHSLTE